MTGFYTQEYGVTFWLLTNIKTHKIKSESIHLMIVYNTIVSFLFYSIHAQPTQRNEWLASLHIRHVGWGHPWHCEYLYYMYMYMYIV